MMQLAIASAILLRPDNPGNARVTRKDDTPPAPLHLVPGAGPV